MVNVLFAGNGPTALTTAYGTTQVIFRSTVAVACGTT
jgi:hypothetical protein